MKELEDIKKGSRVVLDHGKLTTEILLGQEILTDEDGERFYQIKENPEAQIVLSRILKGHLNIADIIKIKDKFYSHEPKKELLESYSKVEEEIDIELLILRFIFNDRDHRTKGSDVKKINLITVESDKFYIYDLGKADQFWFWSYNFFSYRVDEILNSRKTEVLELLKTKLVKLLNFYNSGSGAELLGGIFANLDLEINVVFPPRDGELHTIDSFRVEIVSRINFIVDKINKKII